ncbi:MAG: putative Ig domain-containing protein [Acidobacteriota bacterium]|nr:putative Ig domain-containing protein [Acidobacteriota bacterium]
MTRPSFQASFKYRSLCTLFIVLLTTLFLGQPTKHAADHSALPNLQGAAAIEYLKQQGLYASLGEAMAAARYGVYEAAATESASYRFYANNPAQSFQARFSPDGLSLKTASAAAQDHPLNLDLRSVGYGAQQFSVTPGKLTANGNRIEINRAIQSSTLQTPITEWYINKADGLEQGFTLAQPPGERRANEPLRLTLQVEADWQMQPLEDGQAVAFHNTFTGETLRYDKLLVQDATGRELSSQMQLQEHELRLVVADAAAVYPLTIDPTITQQAKLTAADGAANDTFGWSVAVDGDTVVIGTPLDDVGANSDQGSAYVFSRNQGGANNWGQVKMLTAADGAAFDTFGVAVAVDGDTIVVGTNSDDVGANTNQGSAYVFSRNQGGANNWGQVNMLTAADGEAFDNFGWSVMVDGDTIVVGANLDKVGANGGQGSAYVFSRNHGGANNWGQVNMLTAADGTLGDNFGKAVAVDGDTIVVGANLDRVGANDGQGSAYVFSRNQGGADNWGQVTKLTAADGAAFDNFGIAVGVDGDTIVVGAYVDDVGANTNQGSAYVYSRNQGGANNWGQVKMLIAADGATDDSFGYAVAVDGDTIVVGAYYDAVGANTYQGSSYIYSRNHGGANNWGQVKILTAADGAAHDLFGTAVAVDGDTIVVGALVDNVGANTDQGSAYIFSGLDCNFIEQAHPIASDGAADDNFGYVVAVDGDTIVIGAWRDDVGANTDQGSAYVFSRNQGGESNWGQVAKLTATDGAASDRFGWAVAVDGDTIVVGAWQDDVGVKSDQGSAYIFSRNQGGANNWGEVKKLMASDGVANDLFGVTVALDGDIVVVGASADAVGANNFQGSTYVFSRNQGGANNWGEVKKMTASDGAAGDHFGNALTVDGDTVVIGAYFDDVGANGLQGSAYVFSRNQGGANNWGEVKKLTASDGAAYDNFGYAVALDGDTIVVGAWVDDVGANLGQGSAYVFSRNQGGANNWGEIKKLTASDGVAGDLFGISVAVDGDTIVIGAYFDDVGANTEQGSAYVFSRNQGGVNNWGEVKKLTASDGTANDLFGRGVAVDGDTIVVGAHFDDVGANADQGSAYVFSGVAVCCPTITVTAPTTNTGTAGASFSQTFTQSGGLGAITWSVTGALPTGITLNSSTGVLSGTTTQTGTFPITVKAADANGCFGTVNYTLTIVPAPPPSTARIDDPLVCTGSGNAVSVTATLTNPNATAQSANFTATLNSALLAVAGSCAANAGACTVTNSSTVTWSGTLNAGQTVTIRYLAQVADGVTPGTQLCATSVATVGNSDPATVTACGTVNCPTPGPGNPFPTRSEASDQSAGSVLIYNVFTSSASAPNTQNTRVSLTNTHPLLPANVHLFFVDGASCSVADSYVCLTANQTTSFLLSDLDPGTTGYIVAVATNSRGCPINFNYLIGDEYVKFASGHVANLAAESFTALAGGLPACDNQSVTAALNFDGTSYNRAPAVLALSNVSSRADGNDAMLIVNRLGGNLGVGASTLGTLFGILYDDAENALSFNVTGGCQLRSSLSNNFPRTTPRFETYIPAGRTGWLKVFNQTGAIGMTGAAINFNANSASSAGAFSQGHNLHALTLNASSNYVIPVFPPNC